MKTYYSTPINKGQTYPCINQQPPWHSAKCSRQSNKNIESLFLENFLHVGVQTLWKNTCPASFLPDCNQAFSMAFSPNDEYQKNTCFFPPVLLIVSHGGGGGGLITAGLLSGTEHRRVHFQKTIAITLTFHDITTKHHTPV